MEFEPVARKMSLTTFKSAVRGHESRLKKVQIDCYGWKVVVTALILLKNGGLETGQ